MFHAHRLQQDGSMLEPYLRPDADNSRLQGSKGLQQSQGTHTSKSQHSFPYLTTHCKVMLKGNSKSSALTSKQKAVH
jgi:hypothetical protein